MAPQIKVIVPGLDYEHAALREAVVIPIIVIVCLFHLTSTGLFWYRGRTSKDLQKRSVALALVTGLCATLVCALYLSRNLAYVPCTVAHIGSYFGFYYVHTALFARALRLIAMAQTASAKVKRLLHPERPADFWERHYKVARVLSDDKWVIIYMFALSSPLMIYAVVGLVISPYFGLLANQMACPLGWEGLPITTISCLYIAVIFPTLIYMMRNIRDAYYMRNDLIITCCTSMVFDLFFLVCNFVPNGFPYPLSSLVFPSVSVTVIQVSSIFIPWLRAEREYRTHGLLSLHNQTTFYQVINDPDLVALFCKFCENNFCTELPFFLIDYQRLKAKSVEYMSAEKPLKRFAPNYRLPDLSSRHRNQSQNPPHYQNFWNISTEAIIPIPPMRAQGRPGIRELPPPAHPNATTTSGFTSDHSGPEERRPEVCRVSLLPNPIVHDLGPAAEHPIPSDLAIDYYCFYERYFVDGSAWEVNISGRTLAPLKAMVEREQFHWTMFDAAKDEVSQLLMEDVFGKFLRANSKLVGTI
ncbi:hypothetical protein BJ085DRAFT_31300 [Dimargaris cristalligena]|uniref:RGS domain-containing protein n=1 Tax=Dimargaris cristalligena TaxID=215637 RepID=A0A4P9ZQC4_9FUNG|nr:hypothetical protein BJ085DRAFT_31300 [Dimargaris cristalligena]|eukprot:RKP34580.1 hypothetical protein BJ085DRAFT_31300 [Dimargaris cristalligena]